MVSGWTEIWSFESMGSKLSALTDGAEVSIGITNMLARTGVSNTISPFEARKLAAALVQFADSAETHRGWTISRGRWPEPEWSATSPDYDASYEGPEDGWVSNGQSVEAATREALVEEIDAWIEEHAA